MFADKPDIVFGRQDPAQQGANFKFVPSGIQGRVGEHGNPDELDLVQDPAGNISPAAPALGLAPLVDMEFKFVGLVGAHGHNGVIGTDHGAHGAPHAVIGRGRFLADAVIGLKAIFRPGLDPGGGIHHPFAENCGFNGMDRADGRAFPAQGALVHIPGDLPGQILDA